ncbi:MAG: hypothetical protein R2851_05330 [Caldilineaceae bacterium]
MAFPLGPGGGGLSSLVEAAPQRLDYVTGYMLALWRRLGQHQTANSAFLVRKGPTCCPPGSSLAATRRRERLSGRWRSTRARPWIPTAAMALRLGLEYARRVNGVRWAWTISRTRSP